MRLDEDFIDRSPEEGARLVALALVGQADGAAKVLSSADPEALHEFRVALRRLRTALKAFHPVLAASVSRKLERRVKKLARSTNAARDAEVQLAWLASHAKDLETRARRPGLELLVGRFEARRAAGLERQRELHARYAKASRKLAARLRGDEARIDAEGERPPFSALLAASAANQVEALRERLGAIRGADDREAVHEARIQGKRLRYLLEPLKGNRHADAREAVAELKGLQDVLGDLHDTHVLGREVEAALVDAAQERARQAYAAAYRERARDGGAPDGGADRRTGLLAVARLARDRRDALFAELQGPWRAEKLDRLCAAIHGVVAALQARAAGTVERARPPEVVSARAFSAGQPSGATGSGRRRGGDRPRSRAGRRRPS